MVELSEKEKQIIDLRFNQGKTYPEICKILKVSPKTISNAIKKHEGRWDDGKTKQVENSENYSEIYRLFSEDKTPLNVARTLNLHADFVAQLHTSYLEMVGLENAVRLYNECKADGIQVLRQTAEAMKENGIPPRNFGAAIRYFQQYHQEGMKLEEVREEQTKVRESISKRSNDLEKIEDRTKDANAELAHVLAKKKVEEANVSKLKKEGERLRQLDPRITIRQIAEERANEILHNNERMLDAALGAIMYAVRSSPAKYALVFPERLPKEVLQNPHGLRNYQGICWNELVQIGSQMYRQLLSEIVTGVEANLKTHS